MVIAQPPPQAVAAQPLYPHVPPGHAKHWRKHCYRYNARGQPVCSVRPQEFAPGDGRKQKHKGKPKHGDDD